MRRCCGLFLSRSPLLQPASRKVVARSSLSPRPPHRAQLITMSEGLSKAQEALSSATAKLGLSGSGPSRDAAVDSLTFNSTCLRRRSDRIGRQRRWHRAQALCDRPGRTDSSRSGCERQGSQGRRGRRSGIVAGRDGIEPQASEEAVRCQLAQSAEVCRCGAARGNRGGRSGQAKAGSVGDGRTDRSADRAGDQGQRSRGGQGSWTANQSVRLGPSSALAGRPDLPRPARWDWLLAMRAYWTIGQNLRCSDSDP